MVAGATRSKGVLSDQDLLAEVLGSRYLELDHDVIMFPSWFNHSNINHRRADEILKAMQWEDFDRLQPQQIDAFIESFGAVHFSASFAPAYDKTEDDKKLDLYNMGGQKTFLRNQHGATISNEAYIENFLMPLWQKLRMCYDSRGKQLQTSIARAVGATPPTPGLSRALITLMNRGVRPLPKSRPRQDDEAERLRQRYQSAHQFTQAKSSAPKPPPPPVPPWRESSNRL